MATAGDIRGVLTTLNHQLPAGLDGTRIDLCACNFYNHPSKFMKMIGITTTNGKTTTAFMVDNILEINNFKTGLVGTVLIKVGDEQIASDLTTPESLDLQNYIYRMKENGLTHVTMEDVMKRLLKKLTFWLSVVLVHHLLQISF